MFKTERVTIRITKGELKVIKLNMKYFGAKTVSKFFEIAQRQLILSKSINKQDFELLQQYQIKINEIYTELQQIMTIHHHREFNEQPISEQEKQILDSTLKSLTNVFNNINNLTNKQ